jgi:hypothetical protein
LTDTELRQVVGCYLNSVWIDGVEMAANRTSSAGPVELLCHAFVNGNPLAMAAGRLAPPAPEGADHDDWLARHTREIRWARGCRVTGV